MRACPRAINSLNERLNAFADNGLESLTDLFASRNVTFASIQHITPQVRAACELNSRVDNCVVRFSERRTGCLIRTRWRRNARSLTLQSLVRIHRVSFPAHRATRCAEWKVSSRRQQVSEKAAEDAKRKGKAALEPAAAATSESSTARRRRGGACAAAAEQDAGDSKNAEEDAEDDDETEAASGGRQLSPDAIKAGKRARTAFLVFMALVALAALWYLFEVRGRAMRGAARR